MSYSDSQFNPTDEELKNLHKKLEICNKVVATLETPGWKDIISPIIDSMIIGVLGGKIGDNWSSGKIMRARSEEKREYYIGYKQALIDLHTRILLHQSEKVKNEDLIKGLKENKSKGYRIPMVEDSRYAL